MLLWRVALVALAAVACAGSGREPAPRTPARPPEATGAMVDGCPLRIGRLPVRTWVGERAGRLSIRFVPVNSDFAHCLDLGALSLVSPSGEEIPGEPPSRGWGLPLTFGSGRAVPAKIDDRASKRTFGVGVGLRLPWGGAPERSSTEFTFDAPDVGPGWHWKTHARDRCAELDVPIRIPVERLSPCGGD